MPFSRPTLRELIDRAIADIEAKLDGSDPRLRFSFENAVAHAIAGLAHGLHGHLVFLSRQILPDTCGEAVLRRWASILNVTPLEPSKATGTIRMTGADTTVVPALTRWRRADGIEFETVAEATVDGSGEVDASVIAVESGSTGNTPAGSPFSISSPIAGLDSSALVLAPGLTGGSDPEKVEELRVRVLLRWRTPPSGGGPGDYVRWAREVAGVTRAWESKNELGPGTVVVRFAVDGEVSPIPSGGKVTEVQTYIDGKAPVTADPTVVAPIAVDLDPEIQITPDTPAVRAAVEEELKAYILRTSAPGATHFVSQIREAISVADGEEDHVLVSPAANVVLTTGQLLVLGTITWS